MSEVDTGGIHDLDRLLAEMRPLLHAGRYAFTTLPPGRTSDPAQVVASIRETEGLSVVLTEADALALDLPIAFLCHHGVSSRQAAEYFRGLGFHDLHNVEGGIDAWSRQIDPKVPLY